MARQRGGTRMVKDWSGLALTASNIDVGVNMKALCATFVPSDNRTILCSRGNVMVQLDATAADERVIVALGMIVVNEVAAGVGITALPGPFAQANDDWFWHGWVNCSSLAEAAVANDALFERLVIDSKVMRKIRVDERIVFMAEVAGSNDQGGTFDLKGGIRILSGS